MRVYMDYSPLSLKAYLSGQRYAGENLLRTSGVPYTVVRPGGLTNKPGFQHKVIAGGVPPRCHQSSGDINP
jgi:hypothetical protein